MRTKATIILLALGALAGCAKDTDVKMRSTPYSIDSRYSIGEVLYENAFTSGLDDFQIELEKGGDVSATDGSLTIDVPAGCSVWLKRRFDGPLMIEYDATFVTAGGRNDRLSDLNLFWMANDARNENDFFAVKRTGTFADYNQLKCYYAGIGGNANSTTRFRRYIGDAVLRPLLPENDLNAPSTLLEAGQAYHIRAIACGSIVQLFRNDQKLFELSDPEPYRAGYFAFRTVSSHQLIRNLKISRLIVK